MYNDYEGNGEFTPARSGVFADGGASSLGGFGSRNFSNAAKIKVIGVGGEGNNAVNRLIESKVEGSKFIVVNTDCQDLACSLAPQKIQIGIKLTKGLGAGSDPAVGRAAAEENKAELQEILKDTDLLFITAGMGGGTGTGAAPVIAKLAKDLKILTVAVVTVPFSFEGKPRMDNALMGIEELKKSVDSIIVISNDKILEVAPKGTSFANSLKIADDVLRQGICAVTDLIVKPALINLDFADVRTTLKGRGLAHMGTGVAKGEKRISDAVRCAVCSPLLNTTIEGAGSVILNIVGGDNLTLDEVRLAADLVKGVVDYSANVIFGACIDNEMSDEVEVVIIATGFPGGGQPVGMPEDRNAAARRVSSLSAKIERVYNQMGGANMEAAPSARQPYGGYSAPVQQPYGGYAANNAGAPYGGYAGQNAPAPSPMPYANYSGYPGTAPYGAPAGNGTRPFEPEDPIPDQAAAENDADRKHRPKFVDFFIKKNSNK